MAAFLQIMRQTLVHVLHLTDVHGWHLRLGDDCTPGRGIRDMMQPEANKPEAVDRRSRPRACWPKDASYP